MYLIIIKPYNGDKAHSIWDTKEEAEKVVEGIEHITKIMYLKGVKAKNGLNFIEDNN